MGVKVREKVKGSGEYWIFVNHQGKRISKFVGDVKKAHEAAGIIKAKLVLGDLDIDQMQKSETPTLREYAELWLDSGHNWKESTRESYESNLRVHIYPALGSYKINRIKPKILKSFFQKLLSDGLASSMIKRVKASLTGVLKDAVSSELIESNPLDRMNLRLPKTVSPEIIPLTEEQAFSLLDQAKKFLDGAYYPVILCALRTGMRIGEIQALEWSDIDFNSRLIQVKRSWRKGRLTVPKNGKGRSIGMTPHLAETLKRLKTERMKTALKTGVPLEKLVFNGNRNVMLHRETFKNALNRCLEKAGIPHIRVHDLRHTYATIRLLRGHNIGDVCHQLGHSSIKITYDIYGHWIPGKFQSEVDSLDYADEPAPYAHPKI